MVRFKLLLSAAAVGLGLALAATPSFAAPTPINTKEAEIPFARFGGIQDWRADGSRALYVRGRNNQWYHATLMNSCPSLPFAIDISTRHDARDVFDRFSSIVVDDRECYLSSLVMSDPPPRERR